MCVLFACALCCSGFSALAAEDGVEGAGDDVGGAAVATPSPALPQPLQVELTVIDGSPAADVTPAPDPVSSPSDENDGIMDMLERIEANTQGDTSSTPSGVTSVSELDPAQANREGLAGTVSQLFGEYTPRTYTVSTYIDGKVVTGTEIVPGLAGLDWPWLCGAGLFAIMLFCLFKLLGGIWR